MVHHKKKPKNTGKKQKLKTKNQKRYDIFIIEDRCKGCRLCVLYCPTDTLGMSEKVNANGNFVPKIKDISKCKGCKLCFKMCPDFAIFVEDK
jgi:2-oxoglutarate ferredoxin oxidoreductase subunit delta